MNYEKLIDFIVNEVYNKLNQMPTKRVEEAKKAVVVWPDEMQVYHILSPHYDVISYNAEIRDCDIVIIPKLCLRGLYNLSQGSSVSSEERFILKMLMKGKKVYILSEGLEYKKYKETAPRTLYNKYIKYEDELVGFGINVIKDLSEIVTQSRIEPEKMEEVAPSLDNKKECQLMNKKLISEADVKKVKYSQMTTLVIDKGSIITPLAKDFIRTNNLKVTKV